MSRSIFVLSALVLLLVGVSQAAVTGDFQSTLKIGQAMCAHNVQDTITKFFDCYSHAPGKDLFVRCQKQIYGVDLSTTQGVQTVCDNKGKLLQYAGCLRQSFKDAGVDLGEAVGQVNKCQAYVLGVE